MSRKDKAERRSREVKRVKDPDRAAKLGKSSGVKSAFCPKCRTWYDPNNYGQSMKHDGH